MSHLEKEKQKLIARIKRIRGQVDSIERCRQQSQLFVPPAAPMSWTVQKLWFSVEAARASSRKRSSACRSRATFRRQEFQGNIAVQLYGLRLVDHTIPPPSLATMR